ncbi:MAG TPA: phospholipase [Sulfurimonas sp.]|nr:phospholipase [Sulfurimonas sp.]
MKYIHFLLFIPLLLLSEQSVDIDDVKNLKTKSSMQKWLDHDFGLKPYKTNYLLPYGYAETPYTTNVPTLEYKNIEAELQVSLMLQVGHNLLGLREKYYVSYTHQAFWQIYIESAPFRETTYNPEGFVVFPIEDTTSIFGLRSLKFTLAHKSNGQPDTSEVVFANNQNLGNLSRSINYVKSTLRLQHDTLVTDISAWVPIASLDDNPDIMDYMGYTSVKFTYFLDDNMFTFKTRGNISTSKGAIELTYSHPLIHNNLYVKFFSGYMESLVDYNRKVTKLSVGFSFSR